MSSIGLPLGCLTLVHATTHRLRGITTWRPGSVPGLLLLLPQRVISSDVQSMLSRPLNRHSRVLTAKKRCDPGQRPVMKNTTTQNIEIWTFVTLIHCHIVTQTDIKCVIAKSATG